MPPKAPVSPRLTRRSSILFRPPGKRSERLIKTATVVLGSCQPVACRNSPGGAQQPGSFGFGPQSASQNLPPLLIQLLMRACQRSDGSGSSPKLTLGFVNPARARAPPWFFLSGFSSVPGSGTPLAARSARRACLALPVPGLGHLLLRPARQEATGDLVDIDAAGA